MLLLRKKYVPLGPTNRWIEWGVQEKFPRDLEVDFLDATGYELEIIRDLFPFICPSKLKNARFNGMFAEMIYANLQIYCDEISKEFEQK